MQRRNCLTETEDINLPDMIAAFKKGNQHKQEDLDQAMTENTSKKTRAIKRRERITTEAAIKLT